MKNQLLGKYGEDRAVSHLEEKGFEILERNYRHGRGEIDIIGLWKNQLLVFFEVKLRKNNAFGEPETFVTENQQQHIINAAEEYIHGINWKKDIRFDIIAIKESELEHIEDAFY
ncbi:YraN family protein [Marinoscillum sp. MHG1-6]|uniref:YraN family protein n=1 Tax=Marinoscillum sp. MHG1-6 TaxID=2959627 RepID=UPI0021572080|nr:YraN family protein [Marinoscillum sp. MHG1-6]